MSDNSDDYIRRLENEARARERDHRSELRKMHALHRADIEQRERALDLKRTERNAALAVFGLFCLFSAWPALGPAYNSRRPVATFFEYFVAEAVFWLGLYFAVVGGIMITKFLNGRGFRSRYATASGWLGGLAIIALLAWASTLDAGVMRAADHLRDLRDGLAY